ncbi:hypothetical protein ACFLZC_02575 [Patescibacteria group bacterium]
MKIQKPKSHVPKIHDNTEEDLILVPPSVLDNKLRDFESYHKAQSSIVSDIALAVTLVAAFFASTFRDFAYISGATIKGAFLVGFLAIAVKIGFSIYKINKDENNHTRESTVKSFLDKYRYKINIKEK